MKKFAKMSLIAAIAVAGTTASAQPLAEAIKNVDVSGTAAYRYNDYEDNAGVDSAENNYKIAVNLKSKVNDDITANSRILIGNGTTNPVTMGTSSDSDAQADVVLSEINFTYTGVQGLSVTAGKQGIATPWTVSRDAMGDEQTGTGIVAVYTAGPVSLVGAYFNQTNFNQSELSVATGAEDIYVIGAMGSFAGVNLEAFYADLQDTFDSYTVAVDGSLDLGSVTLAPFARYSSLDPELSVFGTDKTQDLWQLGLSANMGIFSAFAAYGESGSDGGLVYVDSGASTNMDYHWRVTADGSADTEYLYVHGTADVTDKINVGLFYSQADYKSGADVSEVYAQVKYQMSKNFSTYVRYGDIDVDGDDSYGNMGRVHVQYSF